MRSFEKALDNAKLVYYDYDDDGFAEQVVLTSDKGVASVKLDKSFLLWRVRIDVTAYYGRIPHASILDSWFVTLPAKQLELLKIENIEKTATVEDAKKLLLSLIKEGFGVAAEKTRELLDTILEKKVFVKKKT
jgi:hypothetical protein